MIVVEILGGLGNQLFEYAHAKSISKELDQELLFDLSFFNRYHRDDVFRLDRYNTSLNMANERDISRLKRKAINNKYIRGLRKRIGLSTYKANGFHFDNEAIDRMTKEELKQYDDLYISGFFADLKYFKSIENEIRKEFTLKSGLNKENRDMIAKIKKENSISLHVRRGDYVGNIFFTEIPPSYYQKSIDYMKKRINNFTLFVFSDDIEWVKKNLKIEQNIVFVNINDAKTDYMELMLMSACNHNIIANSTFSWWGAWLNNNQNKIVIAPKIWFNNKSAQKKYQNGALVPKDWIKL